MPILKLFQSIRRKGTLQNSFSEARVILSITLITEPDKHTTMTTKKTSMMVHACNPKNLGS
jgi:hypothetical protein